MKRHLTAALTALLTAASFTATAQSLVLREDFEAETFPPAGWTTLDSDGDGMSWIAYSGSGANQIAGSRKLAISFTRNPANYSTYPAQDNWLITPPVTITNNAHVLEFKYAAQDLDKSEPMEVLISETDTNPASFTPIYTTTVDNGYEDDIVINSFNRALTAYAGKTIYIAIRHNANATYGLSVDNIYIYNQLGPVKPTSFTATAGTNGAHTVTLAWTNPSRTGNGNTLTDLSIKVYRDGEAIATVPTQPGQSATWTDEAAPAGTHSYTIAAVNGEGEGEKLSARSVYVGEDVPAAPKNLVAMAADGGINLVWEAPTKGASNGYVNLDNLRYAVTRTAGEDTQVLTSDIAGTSWRDTSAPAGQMCVYSVAAVNEAGTSPIDGYSSAIIYGDQTADMGVAITAERDNALARLPIALNDKYAISQTIYTPQDLAFVQGNIKKLVYKAYRGTDSDLTIPVRIYMAPTQAEDLVSGFAAMADAVQVYEGNITLSQGTRDIEITLTNPYAYTGGNLLVTFIKDNTPNGSYSDRFLSRDMGGVARSFTKSVYDPVNISSLPTPGSYDSAVSQLPSTRFIIETSGIGTLSGTIKDAATGAPLEDATLTVAGYEGMSVCSDAQGAYTFRYVPVAASQLTATMPGYEDVTTTFNVSDGTVTTLNINMNQLAHYSLSGTLQAGDTRLAAAGAVVSVEGYDNATTTADADGHWTLPVLYTDKDYILSVAYPLYDIYRQEINYASENTVTMPAIELQRSLIPPYAVDAEVAADGGCVTLNWLDPLSRTGLRGWRSVGDVSVQKDAGGDYSSTNYNVGHYFSSALIDSKNMAGLSVSSIRVWIKATEGTFTAKVWRGTRDDNTQLTAKTIPAEMIKADGAWVTVDFDEPVEIRSGEDYIFGVQCVNASRYPIGQAAKSLETGGSNMLKWSDEGGYIYDAYSPWCIQALCIVPGTETDINHDSDAPACQYNVYRTNDEGTTWEKLTITPQSELTYTDGAWASLVSGQRRYAVTSVYMNGESQRAYSPMLERSTNTDGGVTAFISPAKSVDTRTSVDVTVRVTNFGELPIASFPVSVSMDGAQPLTATCTATLNKGESADVNIGSLEMGQGVHTFTAYTSITGDQTTANDGCTLTISNLPNVELTGYRWSAYGNAGFMKVQTNNPEAAVYLSECTPNDALIIAGASTINRFYGFTATWWGASRQFVEIDPLTWTVERAVENTDDYVLDMAYDYTNSIMYALRVNNDNDVQLVTVNLTDGTTTAIGSCGRVIRTLACDLDGNLYGVDPDGTFVSIDPLTALTTEIGTTGVNDVMYLQSMTFDHNTGRLFWAKTGGSSDGEIHEIDPQTGAAVAMGKALFNGLDEAELVGLYSPYDPSLTGIAAAAATRISLSAESNGTVIAVTPAGGVLSVYAADGACVARYTLAEGHNTLHLQLPAGVYMLRAADTDGAACIKSVLR